MPNPLTDITSDHHIIFGVALIAVGVFGVYGSITGRLAFMLAALFDPGDVVGASTAKTGSTLPTQQPTNSNVSAAAGTGITGDLTNIIAGLGLP